MATKGATPTGAAGNGCELLVYELNDYCTFSAPGGLNAAAPSSAADSPIAQAIVAAGGAISTEGCPAPLFGAFIPQTILVWPPTDEAKQEVLRRLRAWDAPEAQIQFTDAPTPGGVWRGKVTSKKPLTPKTIGNLQAPGVFVDLDWLGSTSAPNWTFRPDDAPDEVVGSPALPNTSAAAAGKSVAVFDTPAVTSAADAENNEKYDENYGHAEFVRSLFSTYSGAATTLYPVGNAQAKAAGMTFVGSRWAPMVFAEDDLLEQLVAARNAVATYDAWNLSLGIYACPGDVAGVVLLKVLDELVQATSVPIFAAGGNSGGKQPHYPAALRDYDEMQTWAIPDVEAKNQVLASAKMVVTRLHGVGSVDVDASEIAVQRSDFSTCGPWVDVQAPGRKQVAEYPGRQGTVRAAWSGSSFATARATAKFLTSGELTPAEPSWFASC